MNTDHGHQLDCASEHIYRPTSANGSNLLCELHSDGLIDSRGVRGRSVLMLRYLGNCFTVTCTMSILGNNIQLSNYFLALIAVHGFETPPTLAVLRSSALNTRAAVIPSMSPIAFALLKA